MKDLTTITNDFFKKAPEPRSVLLNGTVGGDIAKELYKRLPTPMFYEETVERFGCPAPVFIFADAVYYVAPSFGLKFNSLEEYIEYYEESQHRFSIENEISIDELPSWDEFAVFMCKYELEA